MSPEAIFGWVGGGAVAIVIILMMWHTCIKDAYRIKSIKDLFVGCVTNKQFNQIIVKIFSAEDFKQTESTYNDVHTTITANGYTLKHGDYIRHFSINGIYEFTPYQKCKAMRLIKNIQNTNRKRKIKESLGL